MHSFPAHFILLIPHHSPRKMFDSSLFRRLRERACFSLYPAAMAMGNYPIEGYTSHVDELELHELCTQPAPWKVGVYDVSFVPNKALSIAILPRKNAHGGLEWTLEDGRGIFTSVDIDNAISFGYTITQVHHAKVYEHSAPIFKNYVLRCYEMKKEAKSSNNASLYQAAKLLLNCEYTVRICSG